MEGDIVLNMIDHLDHQPVAFPCYDSRPRKLPIHGHNALCLTKSRHTLRLDLLKAINKQKCYQTNP